MGGFWFDFLRFGFALVSCFSMSTPDHKKKKKRFQPVFARYFFFVFIVLSSGILSVRNADLESTDRPKMVGFFFVTCSFSARRCSFLGCLLGARMSTWYLIRATQDSAIYHRPHVFSHFSPLSREGESRSGITRSEVSVLKLLLRVLREAWPEPALFLCSPRSPVFAHIPAGKRVHVEMKRLGGLLPYACLGSEKLRSECCSR